LAECDFAFPICPCCGEELGGLGIRYRFVGRDFDFTAFAFSGGSIDAGFDTGFRGRFVFGIAPELGIAVENEDVGMLENSSAEILQLLRIVALTTGVHLPPLSAYLILLCTLERMSARRCQRIRYQFVNHKLNTSPSEN
jgi:hypothetical protein